MTILAGKNDESVVKIISSEDHPICYEEVNGETVDPFKIDADTLEGKSLDEILSKGTQFFTFVVTALADSWSSEAPYTQTVHVDGMKDGFFQPVCSVQQTGDSSSDAQLRAQVVKITRIATRDNSVIFECAAEKPSIDLPIQISAWENGGAN